MTPRDDLSGTEWEARIARAQQLHDRQPEILDFYARLATEQRALFQRARLSITGTADEAPVAFAQAIARDRVVAAIPAFIIWVIDHGPAQLALGVSHTAGDTADQWRCLVETCLAEGETPLADPVRAFVIEAVLQPFAEAAARGSPPPSETSPPSRRCPRCGARPAVAVLREAGHGARRALVCGLCQTEWPVSRIGCAGCDEARFELLPVFHADSLEALRIDACDTCRVYVKTIDLTRDAHAVPIVDDLASLALDLWARAEGYRRLRPNLLRL